MLVRINLKEGNMLMVISATELVIESSSRVCHRKDLNFSVVCIEGEGGEAKHGSRQDSKQPRLA